MPAPPARASLFPAGALLPATFKTLLAELYDYTVALLGSAGTAADAVAALGSGAGWAPTVTGGAATAFTLTPSEASTANAAGQRYRVSFHAAAGATPTLAVSGQTAKNLKYYDGTAAKKAITAKQVPINWISDVEYDGTDWVVLQPCPDAGTQTNDAAATGYVGEYVESAVSSVSAPASTQFGDVTSITLTAGDWDVSGVIECAPNGATITGAVIGGIGTATGNSSAGLAPGNTKFETPGPGTTNVAASIPPVRKSIAGSTTYYLKMYATYSAGTPLFFGRISARRVR